MQNNNNNNNNLAFEEYHSGRKIYIFDKLIAKN